MKPTAPLRNRALSVVASWLGCWTIAGAEAAETLTRTNQPAVVVTTNGPVLYFQSTNPPAPALLNQFLNFGDTLRTYIDARAAVRFFDWSGLKLKDQSRLEIIRDASDSSSPAIRLLEGEFYFSSRGGPFKIPVVTPHSEGLTKGTEFVVRVDAGAGRSEYIMFEGEVELSNDVDRKRIRAGQHGVAIPGQPIQVLSRIEATKLVQWWVYYPGCLDPEELGLSATEQDQLAGSLTAYRAGALSEALRQYPGYPAAPSPTTGAGGIYYASLLLSVGSVDRAQRQLSQADSNAPPARALRILIDAVAPPLPDPGAAETLGSPAKRHQSEQGIGGVSAPPDSSSQWLARSYAHQSTNNLAAALAAARAAAARSPKFGFAWARIAELEFSFGRTAASRKAVERALELSASNAQAHALNGFLLAAERKLPQALQSFDRAIELDPLLGNAWLGRGLCKRRMSYDLFGLGTSGEWQRDVQTAAILEPTRSLARSYAGKAFAEVGLSREASHELAVAKQLDPNDPTAWFYSAWLNHEQHRMNQAVEDLEKSIALNDHRAVYRSRFLLDEDLAVRSTSLARVYQDAGMNDVALREAARAVSYDYANYSTHLFLAESYDALRDPTRFNLRHETVWFNELLLANLLAPVGAGTFSQNISQQEYGRLFEANRIGLTTSTEYRSDGQWRERATQSATLGRFGYALDVDYQHNDGTRPNNELDRLEWYSTLKLELSPNDALLALTKFQNFHSGDNFQYYDWDNGGGNGQSGVRTNFNLEEFQHPIALLGYHREWAPGNHTLLLGGRLENDQRQTDTPVSLLVMATNTGTPVAFSSPFAVRYRSQLEIYTAELSQILEHRRNTLVAGLRYQAGQFDTRDSLTNIPFPGFFRQTNIVATDQFHHLAVYAYDTIEPFDRFRLTGGLAYDEVRFPRNYRQVPITEGEETSQQVSPKAALVWTPLDPLTFRGVYSRSLGGVNLDESYRLEPVQLAGFSQAFRTLIPESVAGSVSAPEFETRGVALDLKLPSRTYVGLEAEWLSSTVDRADGTYTFNPLLGGLRSTTREKLDFDERTAAFTIHQLAGDCWSFGAQYRFTRDELQSHWPTLDPAQNPGFNRTQTSDLHTVAISAVFQHPAGPFARAEAAWYLQRNRLQTNDAAGLKVVSGLPDDQFPQLNVFVGYRLPRRRGDISFGVLNATGQDYHLNPLNTHAEWPHERVFVGRLRLDL